MLQDRLSGMSWLEVAQRHGVGLKHSDARRARDASNLCMNSAAAHRLTPAEVERLQSPELQYGTRRNGK